MWRRWEGTYADAGEHAGRGDAEVDVADLVDVCFSEDFRQLSLGDVVAVDEGRPRSDVEDATRLLK